MTPTFSFKRENYVLTGRENPFNKETMEWLMIEVIKKLARQNKCNLNYNELEKIIIKHFKSHPMAKQLMYAYGSSEEYILNLALRHNIIKEDSRANIRMGVVLEAAVLEIVNESNILKTLFLNSKEKIEILYLNQMIQYIKDFYHIPTRKRKLGHNYDNNLWGSREFYYDMKDKRNVLHHMLDGLSMLNSIAKCSTLNPWVFTNGKNNQLLGLNCRKNIEERTRYFTLNKDSVSYMYGANPFNGNANFNSIAQYIESAEDTGTGLDKNLKHNEYYKMPSFKKYAQREFSEMDVFKLERMLKHNSLSVMEPTLRESFLMDLKTLEKKIKKHIEENKYKTRIFTEEYNEITNMFLYINKKYFNSYDAVNGIGWNNNRINSFFYKTEDTKLACGTINTFKNLTAFNYKEDIELSNINMLEVDLKKSNENTSKEDVLKDVSILNDKKNKEKRQPLMDSARQNLKALSNYKNNNQLNYYDYVNNYLHSLLISCQLRDDKTNISKVKKEYVDFINYILSKIELYWDAKPRHKKFLFENYKEKLIISPIIDMVYEYRIPVVDGKPVCGSPCFRRGTPIDAYKEKRFFPGVCFGHNAKNIIETQNARNLVAKYIKFARKLCKELREEGITDYTIDVAFNRDTQEVVPIELNSLTKIGLYNINTDYIIRGISKKFNYELRSKEEIKNDKNKGIIDIANLNDITSLDNKISEMDYITDSLMEAYKKSALAIATKKVYEEERKNNDGDNSESNADVVKSFL